MSFPRVLLADGDPASALVAKLTGSDWEPDAERALRAVEAHPYDIVLADCHLADLGGLWLLRQVRVRRPRALGVLLVPAPSPTPTRTPRDAVIDLVLTRPFGERELTALIERDRVWRAAG